MFVDSLTAGNVTLIQSSLLLGYIGGSVLERLLDHPDSARFQITAIVRSAEKAEKLKKLGVDVVVGSHSDADNVRDAAAKADVVFTVVSILHAHSQSSPLELNLLSTESTLRPILMIGVPQEPERYCKGLRNALKRRVRSRF